MSSIVFVCVSALSKTMCRQFLTLIVAKREFRFILPSKSPSPKFPQIPVIHNSSLQKIFLYAPKAVSHSYHGHYSIPHSQDQ